jgi:hypothetical protein
MISGRLPITRNQKDNSTVRRHNCGVFDAAMGLLYRLGKRVPSSVGRMRAEAAPEVLGRRGQSRLIVLDCQRISGRAIRICRAITVCAPMTSMVT